MSSDVAADISEGARGRSSPGVQRSSRTLTLKLLGPVTIVGGLAWAVFQPYRIAFLHPYGKNIYDFLAQPPLLVVLVGALFALLLAPGLVQDLEKAERGPQG